MPYWHGTRAWNLEGEGITIRRTCGHYLELLFVLPVIISNQTCAIICTSHSESNVRKKRARDEEKGDEAGASVSSSSSSSSSSSAATPATKKVKVERGGGGGAKEKKEGPEQDDSVLKVCACCLKFLQCVFNETWA